MDSFVGGVFLIRLGISTSPGARTVFVEIEEGEELRDLTYKYVTMKVAF